MGGYYADTGEMFNISIKSLQESKYVLRMCKNGNKSLRAGLGGRNHHNQSLAFIKDKENTLQIEQYNHGKYILVLNSQSKDSNIKERANYLVLAYNFSTNNFQSVKLDTLLNQNQANYAFLFEFESETGQTIFKVNKSEQLLKSILRSVVEKHNEILKN